MYLHHSSYTTCEISFPLHPWPPHCIKPTHVKCSCLLSFFNYQPEDGQWKVPKHVVDLYVINYAHLYHHIVVLDKYTHFNQVSTVFRLLYITVSNTAFKYRRTGYSAWFSVATEKWSSWIISRHKKRNSLKYRGADKSLARPGRKQARNHVRDASDFNNIETRAVIKFFFFLQDKAPKEIHAILTETLACFLPGRAKDLSAPL